ncbi:MAG: exosortase/archaeosortase family protein [Bacteroidales bacterium]|nr:exosortase/archaeosortase family protein [Bacteroidales bacterium]
MKTTLKDYLKDPKNRSTVDVGLFIILILSFHFLYLGWQALDFWPIKGAIDKLSLWSVELLFGQSCWVLEHIFGIDITTVSETRRILALSRDGSFVGVTIAPLCASLKQWLHWLFLMLIFPGPWKHKAWYIPAGLVIIEWTNVVRICGILMMQMQWPGPKTFHIAHDYIFKVFFYLVIFLMWVLWVEKFKNKKQKKAEQHE